MLSYLPLNGLRAFEAVARHGSFKAAAGELNLTASALSHAVANLERALDVRLLHRDGRVVRLTVNGDLLMRHVRVAFDEIRRGLDGVRAQQGRALLRLHAAPSFASACLSARLPRFLAAHPQIEVRLAAGTDYVSFESGAFDADIVYGPVSATGVIALPIAEETVTPLCAPALAAAIRTPADLRGQNLILSDNKQVRWPHWFEANGLTALPSHRLRFDRSFLAISAAADGLGVALESTLLAEREIAAGRLVAPLAGRSVDIRYVGHHLVYPRDTRHGSVALFATWLRAEFDTLSDDGGHAGGRENGRSGRI